MDPAAVLMMYAMNVHVSVFAIAVSAVLYLWPRRHVFLTRQRKRVRILDVTRLSHDTKRFRLALDDEKRVLGLPIGNHIMIFSPNPKSSLIYLCGKWNGELDPDEGRPEVHRCYTPVTGNETLGYFDIVVKVYHPGTVSMPDGTEVTWNDGGKGSLFLDNKKPGDEIEINGPFGVNEYVGRGIFKASGRSITARKFGMIAGGTGITPMLQIVQSALQDEADTSSFSLLYANKKEEDILFRATLDELAEQSKGRFQVQYTIDLPSEDWKGKTGFISRDMIQEYLPAPSRDTLILMCGPSAMIEVACKTNLKALAYDEKAMVVF